MLVKVCEELKKNGFSYLKAITAVDYKDHLEVMYILYDVQSKKQEVLKVSLPLENPKIQSILKIYPAADWLERELYEMFGIIVTGRQTKRLLLEEWNGVDTPLRKSFVWGAQYKKVE